MLFFNKSSLQKKLLEFIPLGWSHKGVCGGEKLKLMLMIFFEKKTELNKSTADT